MNNKKLSIKSYKIILIIRNFPYMKNWRISIQCHYIKDNNLIFYYHVYKNFDKTRNIIFCQNQWYYIIFNHFTKFALVEQKNLYESSLWKKSQQSST
jgi:hypothetical protein